MFACLHGWGNLAALALEFSPVVERTAADTVTLDASGLDRLFGLPQDVAAAIARRAAETGVKASLALASNPDAAICAARGFAGVGIVPYGDEAKFLGDLPIELLQPSGELRETLARWGIRRFRELAALPPLGIAERLGPEGLRLRELARGEAERKLTPLEDPARFEDAIELEYPVDLLEPLAFLLARLLNGLCTRLATRALATDELRLRLRLEGRAAHERTLRLPAPALDSKAFLKLLQLDLAAHPPAAPVEHVWMGMNPVKPRFAQSGLFIPATPEPVKLELTLARIKAIVGEERVGSPELLDTHRPDAFRMVPVGASGQGPGAGGQDQGAQNQGQTDLSTRRKSGALGQNQGAQNQGQTDLSTWREGGALGQNQGAQNQGQTDLSTRRKGGALGQNQGAQNQGQTDLSTRRKGGALGQIRLSLGFRIFRPPRAARVAVTSGRPGFVAADGIRGKVVDVAGPWRTSGDWWTPDPWSRDEWDIALSDGAVYRLYCEPRGWFVEGSYD